MAPRTILVERAGSPSIPIPSQDASTITCSVHSLSTYPVRITVHQSDYQTPVEPVGSSDSLVGRFPRCRFKGGNATVKAASPNAVLTATHFHSPSPTSQLSYPPVPPPPSSIDSDIHFGMATVASFALALCMLAAAYVTLQCVTPPNPLPPVKSSVEDRIRWVASRSRVTSGRKTLLLIWLYHILLTITYPHPPTLICPQPGSLDPNLFGWSTHTVICIFMVLAGGSIRLTAYSQLGGNFTFHLSKPKTLVKRGLYRYVQHPSYTGLFMILIAHLLLFSRRAGAVACWIPRILNIKYMDVPVWILLIGATVVLGRIRIRDEENMLKEEFGKEWEEYHAKTGRLMPGLF